MLRYLPSRPLLILSLIVIIVGACSSNEAGPSPAATGFGPLAVIDDSGTGASLAFGGTGPIVIGDQCVTLTRSNGSVILLVWRSGEVQWSQDEREIIFSSASERRGDPITIRSGDIITVGGESSEDDVPVTRNRRWLAPPHESCSGELFSVHSVTIES